jgi:hypothetical protein
VIGPWQADVQRQAQAAGGRDHLAHGQIAQLRL